MHAQVAQSENNTVSWCSWILDADSR